MRNRAMVADKICQLVENFTKAIELFIVLDEDINTG
jgi:hypothetical protein